MFPVPDLWTVAAEGGWRWGTVKRTPKTTLSALVRSLVGLPLPTDEDPETRKVEVTCLRSHGKGQSCLSPEPEMCFAPYWGRVGVQLWGRE